ncbi:MAG: serine protease [Gammaproteobacteria bacterium]|nr:serine protease [Gammaproteobacteria bacterium]
MRVFIWALALSATAYASVIGGSSELNPVRTHPHPHTDDSIQQIIVKLRSTGAASAQSLSMRDRVANLAVRSGLTMKESRQIFDRMQVMRVEPGSATDSVAATIERLKADPDVEYAVPDERRYIHAVPNDPLYATTGQWYLQADPATPAAVNAQGAWDLTTGDPNLVIADLDTGVRYDHPDLLTVANSGRLLPGYDFIGNATVANDGGGRDADASDPGDWINTADKGTSQFKSCDIDISSWHGTRTAGILGALTNNSRGVAGLTWQSKILPVRVLGKCGGFDSDIIAGMMWAAGLPVSGAPVNPNPAHIINMSLGSTTACPQTYSDAITQLTGIGVLVVVSAGNEGGAVDSPGNCPGVATVAGIRHAGTKVGFSSLGPEVTVSAPAGNCINTISGPCVYSIQTTTNSGTSTPVANDDAYTGNTITPDDQQPKGPNLGTSFSAPIVSGIAGLMLAANSNLNTCQLISRLKEGSLPFPQTSVGEDTQPPACHVPANSSDVQALECICTLDGQTCGAGMANALGAVKAALRPVAAVTLPASVSAGQSVSLSAQNSAAANGHTVSTYQWSSVGKQSVTIQNATSAAATVTAPSCGYATVQLAVTDEVGRVDAANIVLSPTSATSLAPANATDKSCSVAAPAVLLAVCPGSSSVPVGTGTQTFTATVANTSDDSVTWEVNGIVGGDSNVGTITSVGVYTAPAKVASSTEVEIDAVLNSDQTVVSKTNLSITSPSGSHGGGGAMDPLTLIGEALALGAALLSRRYARRSAASSQDFCALR